jgi:hypothetical protein
MAYKIITQPSVEPVTLAEAKDHYRLVAVRRHPSKELAMADYYFHNIQEQ